MSDYACMNMWVRRVAGQWGMEFALDDGGMVAGWQSGGGLVGDGVGGRGGGGGA